MRIESLPVRLDARELNRGDSDRANRQLYAVAYGSITSQIDYGKVFRWPIVNLSGTGQRASADVPAYTSARRAARRCVRDRRVCAIGPKQAHLPVDISPMGQKRRAGYQRSSAIARRMEPTSRAGVALIQ